MITNFLCLLVGFWREFGLAFHLDDEDGECIIRISFLTALIIIPWMHYIESAENERYDNFCTLIIFAVIQARAR
jgi:hypothetical protein